MGERVWFVTGCSTGIGHALAEALTERGERAVITARSVDSIAALQRRAPERILALPLDIADRAAVDKAMRAAMDKFGRIDVLLNNAGVGFAGAVEEASEEETRTVFGTNVFGTLNVIRAALPHMRRQRSGHIITITSIGGIRGGTSVGVYNGSKFALEGLHEAMNNELPPLGIKVTVLEPGLVKTDFRHRSIHRAKAVIEDYAGTSGKVRTGLQAEYPPGVGLPSQTAAAILELVNSDRPAPFRLQLGADAVAAVRAKMAWVAEEMAAWEEFSLKAGGAADSMAMYSDINAANKKK